MAPHQQVDVAERPSFTTVSVVKTKASDDEICLYPSKKCTNLRAKKKNGELHTMCEYHRIRANENQRRLERRRKAAMRCPQTHVPKPTLWNRAFPDHHIMPLPLPEPKALVPTKRHDLLSCWQPIEIEILMACLFDMDEDAASPHRRPFVPVGMPPAPLITFTPAANTINVAQYV